MARKSGAGLVVFLLVLAVAGTTTASGEDGSDLLERYRPILRYDANETYFAQPVSKRTTVLDEDRVYGRIAEQDGSRYLQYWLFYADNAQDRGIVRTGRHEGDWEFVQLRLDDDGAPDEATFAQHSWAEVCSASEIENRDGAPVVYVANGSHASYPRAGTADRPWPDPNDEADGDGREVRPPLTVVADDSPAWVDYSEPWGNSEEGLIPGEQSSPPGPKFQADNRWQQPATFVEEVGLPCGETPPSSWWLLPLLAVTALTAFAAVFLLRRRRRSS